MRTSLQLQLLGGMLCLLAAYAMLYPGLTQPMLTVTGTVEKAVLIAQGKELLITSGELPAFLVPVAERFIDAIEVEGRIVVFDKTRSILDTARELYASGHRPVAGLILLFSVCVPALKALILLLAALPLRLAIRTALLRTAAASGKWSMADVFVIAVFVAYLAANGLQASRSLVEFESRLGTGFGWFTAYCVISILGTQLIAAALRAHWRAPAGPPPAAGPAP